MELVGLNSSFETVGVVDQFESLIWTDRYSVCGDFELYTPVTSEILTTMAVDNFVYLKESEHLMVVEKSEIVTNPKTGNYLLTKGRSLESILDRRIILYDYLLSGNLQTAIQALLNSAMIASSPERNFPNFVFLASTDPAITALTIYSQFEVMPILNVVQSVCESYGVGFKITLNSTNQMVFSFYRGVNRTYDQSDRDPIVFSPKFDNLVNSQYVESKVAYRNIAYVIGEGTGNARQYSVVGSGPEPEKYGLSRREIALNGGDLSANISPVLSPAQYANVLLQRGADYLASVKNTIRFEGEITSGQHFKYGEHFFMGDIVQVENEYGMRGSSMVTEMIYSQDSSKISAIPTFQAL